MNQANAHLAEVEAIMAKHGCEFEDAILKWLNGWLDGPRDAGMVKWMYEDNSKLIREILPVSSEDYEDFLRIIRLISESGRLLPDDMATLERQHVKAVRSILSRMGAKKSRGRQPGSAPAFLDSIPGGRKMPTKDLTKLLAKQFPNIADPGATIRHWKNPPKKSRGH